MRPTDDSFRALARSSPWRWRSLHLVRRDVSPDGDRVREAWYRRPDGLRVVQDGAEREHRGMPHHPTDPMTTTRRISPARRRRLTERGWRRHDRAARFPTTRPDGLVASRADDPDVDHLIDGNYTWIAALDPYEASAGVTLSDVRAGTWHDREAWFATLVPDRGDGLDHQPRCENCCDLFPNLLTAQESAAYGGFAPGAPEDYPDRFEIALDVETGVLVLDRPIGGGPHVTHLDVRILEVDPDLDHLFGPAPAMWAWDRLPWWRRVTRS